MFSILKAREHGKVLSDTKGNFQAIPSWMGSGLAYYSWDLKFSHQHCQEKKFFFLGFVFLITFISCVSVGMYKRVNLYAYGPGVAVRGQSGEVRLSSLFLHLLNHLIRPYFLVFHILPCFAIHLDFLSFCRCFTSKRIVWETRISWGVGHACF